MTIIPGPLSGNGDHSIAALPDVTDGARRRDVLDLCTLSRNDDHNIAALPDVTDEARRRDVLDVCTLSGNDDHNTDR